MEKELNGYSVPEIIEFVGKGNEKYLIRFKSLQRKRKFNFAAALFGGYWFGYRKMWLEGVAVMIFAMQATSRSPDSCRESNSNESGTCWRIEATSSDGGRGVSPSVYATYKF